MESGWSHFEAREYDPVIGRWTAVDPARQFNSPYNGMGNNPIRSVDPDGRKIRWNIFKKQDKAAAANTINDLEEITGLILFENADGDLGYIENFEGYDPGTSATARSDLMAAIDNKTTLSVVSGKQSAGAEYTVMLSSNQIAKLVNGASGNLDNRTLGFGMTFLHEMHHTKFGINKLHPPTEKNQFGVTTDVVNRMNSIRGELGTSWGQRTSYRGIQFSSGGKAYLPFDNNSKASMIKGYAPNKKTQFIAY